MHLDRLTVVLGAVVLALVGSGRVPAADSGADVIRAINGYRQSQGLPNIPSSAKLDQVAAAHIDDLVTYHPERGTHPVNGRPCNLHSWSAHGNWTPCDP